MSTRNLTIMFTDIKGFTERTSGSTRQDMKALLDIHDRLLVPVFGHFDGTIVKTIGDAFLVHFDSPTDAVLCGVTIQEVLRQHNEGTSDSERLDVRVAINVGEVDLRDGDVLGEAVNIAARLEGVTEAGEVWFTDAVYQTMNRSEAPSAEVGERIFKGIPHPIRVYKVINDPGSDLAKHLANTVQLSDSGPLLVGMQKTRRTPSASHFSKKYFAYAVGAAAMVIIITASLLWMPSEAERAIVRANELLLNNNTRSALDVIDKVLTDDPGNAVLIARAGDIATLHLDAMVKRGEYEVSLSWLERELETKPYLEHLRTRTAELDAHVTVNKLLNQQELRRYHQPPPLQDLLSRHPANSMAPYTAGRLLEKQWYPITRIWLFEEAHKRGQAAEPYIFNTAVDAMSKGAIYYPRFEQAREFLLEYYREDTLGWATDALQNSNVMAYMNAWEILKVSSDPMIEDNYYLALHSLIDLNSEETLQNAITQFKAQQETERRRQIVDYMQEMVDTFPRFMNYTVLNEKMAGELVQFREEWNIPNTDSAIKK